MAQDAIPLEPASAQRASARGLGVVESAVDRATAFRRARRHSTLVRTLRLTLPLAAVLTVASYGLFMQRSIKIGFGDKTIEAGSFSLSREALVAHDPRYTGFDKNGGAFEVKAKTAEQDLKQKGIVRLKVIEGNMIDVGRNRTDLKAARGVLDTNTSILELAEKIDVTSQNGMSAELSKATVYTKENRIVSDAPVLVRMPSGTVRGQAMTIEQKQRQVLFSGGVVANLTPQPKPQAATADPPLRGAQQPGGLTRTDAPVDITSRTLVIDDTAKTATFAGGVVAKQNDQVMETADLQVFYDGDATASARSPAVPVDAPSSRGQAQGQGRLKRLVAKSDVVLTRGVEKATGSSGEFDAVNDRAVLLGPVVISAGPDRGATADRADIDNKTDTILLTGNVIVTQEKNTLKGRRLQADRKQGTVLLSSPAMGGAGMGQISARLYQAESADGVKKKTAASATPSQPSKGGWVTADMRGDPSQPIDIDADTLTVDDRKKTAIFRGKVKAQQSDYTITTEELVATYAGDAGLALGAAPAMARDAATKDAAAKTGAQLQSVVSPRRARITSKDGQRAEGDTVMFDPKANTAKLSGNVILVKGTEFTTAGNCAILDMGSGVMRLVDACGFSRTGPSAAATGTAPGGKAAALVKPQWPVAGTRAQVLLYPQQLKDQQKQGPRPPSASAPSPGAPAVPAGAPAQPQPAANAPAETPVPKRASRPRTEAVGTSIFGGP